MQASTLSRLVTAAVIATMAAACRRSTPAPATTPTSSATDDGGAAARARADSIARADARRRDSIAVANARADSLRRADEMRRASESARAAIVEPVYFDLDMSEIRPSDRAILDRKAAILSANPALRLRIEGNTDERGSDEYNLALGMRRAAEAQRYLVARGIESSRLATSSNGEERMTCQEADESCWSRNRRAEFIIVAGAERIVAERRQP